MPVIVPILLSLLLIPLVLIVPQLVRPRPRCPSCGQPVPLFRAPANRRQALWGGWTCARCDAEIDRHAQIIVPGRSDVANLAGGLGLTEDEGAQGALTQTASGGLEVQDEQVSFDFESDAAHEHVTVARRESRGE